MSLSFSQSEYTVSESDSTFLVQLNKNKALANPLEVVVSALTLEEAYYFGCTPLSTSLEHPAAGTRYMWVVHSIFNFSVVAEAQMKFVRFSLQSDMRERERERERERVVLVSAELIRMYICCTSVVHL